MMKYRINFFKCCFWSLHHHNYFLFQIIPSLTWWSLCPWYQMLHTLLFNLTRYLSSLLNNYRNYIEQFEHCIFEVFFKSFIPCHLMKNSKHLLEKNYHIRKEKFIEPMHYNLSYLFSQCRVCWRGVYGMWGTWSSCLATGVCMLTESLLLPN